MKKHLTITVCLLIFVLFSTIVVISLRHKTGSKTEVEVPTHTVIIQNFSFTPPSMTIQSGQKVTWVNKDTVAHSATEENGLFDTGILSAGESKTVTLTKPGTYTYHCSVHPQMTGSITVQ